MITEKPMERVRRIKKEYVNYLIEIWKYGNESAEELADIKIGYYEDAILMNPYFQMKDLCKF